MRLQHITSHRINSYRTYPVINHQSDTRVREECVALTAKASPSSIFHASYSSRCHCHSLLRALDLYSASISALRLVLIDLADCSHSAVLMPNSVIAMEAAKGRTAAAPSAPVEGVVSPGRKLQLDPATLLRNIYAQTSVTSSSSSNSSSASTDSNHTHAATSHTAATPPTKLSQHTSAFQPPSAPSSTSASTAPSSAITTIATSSSSSPSSGVAIPAPVSATAPPAYTYTMPPSSSPSLFHRPVPINSAFSSGPSQSPTPPVQSAPPPFAASHVPPTTDSTDSEATKRPHKRREAAEQSKADGKKQKQPTVSNSPASSQTLTPHSAFTAVPTSSPVHPTLTSASFGVSAGQSLPQQTAQQQQQPQQQSPNNPASSNSTTPGSQSFGDVPYPPQ